MRRDSEPQEGRLTYEATTRVGRISDVWVGTYQWLRAVARCKVLDRPLEDQYLEFSKMIKVLAPAEHRQRHQNQGHCPTDHG